MEHLFSIGDKIVCVDSTGTARPYLIEGKVYTVIGLKKCEFCPINMVNVGVGSFDNCWHENRFVPLEADSQLEEEIHNALKGREVKI